MKTAYAIVRSLYGKLYLVDVCGFKDGFAEATLKAIAAAAARYKVNTVICEENYGGGMFTSLLKPHLAHLHTIGEDKDGNPITRVGGLIDDDYDGWSTGQKELRILDTLATRTSSMLSTQARRGICKVIERDLQTMSEAPAYSFIHQFTRMARMKGALPHEDRLEAVSMACGFFVERMARDDDNMEAAHKAALLDAELRKFMENVMGFAPRGDNYLDSMNAR